MIFLYHVYDSRGGMRQGEVSAEDRQAALANLAKEGLVVISLKEKGAIAPALKRYLTPFARISAIDRILLTRHLASIIKAGVPLGEAIDILTYTHQKRPLLRKILEEAKRNLEEGHPLSAVFAAYPRYFPPVFVGLVKAGEVSGTLEKTLESLGSQLMRDYDLTRKVRAAMVYPIILLVASGGIITLILTFVLPRLASSFGAANVELPLLTRIIVDTSAVFEAHKALTILVGAGLIAFLVWFFRKPVGKQLLFASLRRLPVSKDLLERLALARFAHTFNNLLKSGIPLVEGFEIVSQSVGNPVYQAAFISMRDEIVQGVSLSDTFRKRESLFPRLVGSLITIGERTGSLENSLQTIATFYDEEVERTLKTLVTLLEPLLLLIMGVIVGGIALSVLLPIYQLIGQLG